MAAVDDASILGSRILIVDDEPANLELLETVLQGEGFSQLLCTTHSERVPALVEAFRPDLVLLDLWMPAPSGFDLLAALAGAPPPDRLMPVIVLTADATRAVRHRALGLGARDFLTKPLDALEVILRCWNQLETVHLAARLRRLEAGLER